MVLKHCFLEFLELNWYSLMALAIQMFVVGCLRSGVSSMSPVSLKADLSSVRVELTGKRFKSWVS